MLLLKNDCANVFVFLKNLLFFLLSRKEKMNEKNPCNNRVNLIREKQKKKKQKSIIEREWRWRCSSSSSMFLPHFRCYKNPRFQFGCGCCCGGCCCWFCNVLLVVALAIIAWTCNIADGDISITIKPIRWSKYDRL